MIADDICAAFCDEIQVHEVPIGYAVKTPFRKESGDAVALYIVWENTEKQRARLEDDGDTIPYLEACGIDFSNEQRKSSLNAMLQEHDCLYDEEEGILYTDYLPIQQIKNKIVGFCSLLLRIQDFLLMMSKEKIEDTFKADLIAAIYYEKEEQPPMTEIPESTTEGPEIFTTYVKRNGILDIYAGEDLSGNIKSRTDKLMDHINKNIMILTGEIKE